MTVMTKENKVQPININRKKDQKTEKSFKDSLTEYLKGVRSEWNKISWPEKQQVISETLVVIAVTTFVTLLIFLIDKLLAWLISLISLTSTTH